MSLATTEGGDGGSSRMKASAGIQNNDTIIVWISMYRQKCSLPNAGSLTSDSYITAEGRAKLITIPIAVDILPTAVAIALSLSPNHVDAILLGIFIKKA